MKPLIIAVLLIAGVIGLGMALRRPATPREAETFSQVPVAPGTGPAPEDARFARLLGEWKRSDGDYVLHVRRIGTNGKADAGYFNPGPIHVAVATASADDGALKMYVELQDRGYPGSAYRLGLDSATDTLRGTYFQATTKASYDVTFTHVGMAPPPRSEQPVIAPAAPPPGR